MGLGLREPSEKVHAFGQTWRSFWQCQVNVLGLDESHNFRLHRPMCMWGGGDEDI